MKYRNHHQLAVLCNEAYDRPDSELWCVHEVDCLVKRTDNGYVILAFRGTEVSRIRPKSWHPRDIWRGLVNIRDVIRDLRFVPWRDKESFPDERFWVHKGFGISAQWWIDEFAAPVDPDSDDVRWNTSRLWGEIKSFSDQIIVTGHSLGAGVAPNVARYLELLGFNVAEVVVFGEPKGHYWGSKRHYETYGIPTTSYRIDQDWIRRAGIGETISDPVILPLPDVSSREAHDIEHYMAILAARVSAAAQSLNNPQ